MGSTSQSGHLLDVGDEWWVLFVDWCYRYTERRSKNNFAKAIEVGGFDDVRCLSCLGKVTSSRSYLRPILEVLNALRRSENPRNCSNI